MFYPFGVNNQCRRINFLNIMYAIPPGCIIHLKSVSAEPVVVSNKYRNKLIEQTCPAHSWSNDDIDSTFSNCLRIVMAIEVKAAPRQDIHNALVVYQ